MTQPLSSESSTQKGSPVTSASPAVSSTPAVLVLADGTVFKGRGFGATGRTLGEAVFSTAMTGYQETLTDPSYHRQLVCATAPQMGNTGWNDEDSESHDERIWAAGFIIRDLSRAPSNWRSKRSLAEELAKQNIIGIRQIDTRALVRHLRENGSTPAGIFSGAEAEKPVDELLEIVRAQPSMAGADLAGEVSCDKAYVVEPEGEAKHTVVAWDLGIKSNTPREMAARGLRVVVVPAETTYEDAVSEYHPDGIFLSNGPGDPATADGPVAVAKAAMADGMPLFGICFGNQILGRALGLGTYKMRFGHRGINIPVKDHTTGVIHITAQNHGFALEGTAGQSFDTEFGPARITHTCLNDGTVEGVALANGKAFSVQYHPESAAGPHDARTLFDDFVALMDSTANTDQEGN
ncbi:glutamine-hydrolyzing carbamoyl-phosphate synthase small subunit [Corynebacterium sp. TAE3-ERU12]|uniref:glutamine-hydrolyzing carbamoyl-phosphate synthase small subunit n=1 Tax=Corynebacterium sp. TAE3-ERU12 TaxID=2849491 RepID=UPI001C45D4CA|nr:glutamine-hydrolyzing carbamoyl-phosphate synthase small subunit [Corynebacterium sp. TAE3-ERU12]MBV7295387.1 glutamine-hydrolyzing carbamoyl-phosphate synthase small subunit [Corynebacterium sp. TAE3-ERU12]